MSMRAMPVVPLVWQSHVYLSSVVSQENTISSHLQARTQLDCAISKYIGASPLTDKITFGSSSDGRLCRLLR